MSGIISNIYDGIVGSCLSAAENGLVPDFIVRIGIRYLLGLRAKDVNASLEQVVARKLKFVQELKSSPVAVATDEANEQHYEVPTEYYLLCLGKHLKYSCCLFLTPNDTLGEAEANMLSLSCVRADLKDGQNVLELGCGWGSFSLYAAAKYPNSKITGVSNSRTQREFIMAQAQERGLTNLQIITANMVDFDAPGTYDRIVTVEMLEHMKNYQELFRRVSTWLKPDGKVFMHVFLHKNAPYHFETEGATAGDWMTKYFFTGGTMPSLDLFLYFQDHLKLEGHWYVNGTNYGRTSENWLVNQDRERAKILPIMYKAYGSKEQGWIWFNRWRMFYLAVAELFKYKNGEEWGVGHFVFTKRP